MKNLLLIALLLLVCCATQAQTRRRFDPAYSPLFQLIGGQLKYSYGDLSFKPIPGTAGIVTTTVTSTTHTPNVTSTEKYYVTAQGTATTIAAPTGTAWADGQLLVFRIKDDGTSRALTWNAVYRVMATALPTATVVNKLLYVTFRWNATDSVWDAVSVIQQS